MDGVGGGFVNSILDALLELMPVETISGHFDPVMGIVGQRSRGLKLLAGKPGQDVKCPRQLKERGLYVGETA